MTGPPDSEGVGCRPSALAGLALLAWALALGAGGLWLVLERSSGLALFYAAAPVSGLLGVMGGGLPVAWPLDLALWVVAGVIAGSRAARLNRPVWQIATAIAGFFLAYGFVMSLFVEVDQLSG